VAAVPIASQSRIKKKNVDLGEMGYKEEDWI
jgi:hypothetical protein